MSGASVAADDESCRSGVEVLVVTPSGFPPEGPGASRPRSGCGRRPPAKRGPGRQTDQDPHRVGQRVGHRGAALQRGEPLDQLAHDGVADQQPTQRAGGTAGPWAGCAAGPLGGLLVGYAVVSELIQGLTPLQRSASVADALADAVGILVGLAAWAALSRRTTPAP